MMHFHSMAIYVHILSQKPLPKGSWNLKFWWGFIAHHYYIFSLSARCTGVKKKTLKNAFSLHDHIWSHLITGTPSPRVMKLTILWGFLAHHYYIFSLSARCTGVKNFQKNIFKEIYILFTHNPRSLGVGAHDIYNF